MDELAERFGVSRMTVHRDLDFLEERRLVRKVHGGATVTSTNLIESNYLYRTHAAAPQKHAIAQAAAELIEPGQAIIIDNSTTAFGLTGYLPAYSPLTVITNGLPVVEQLRDAYGIKVICLGGDYNPRFSAFFGFLCEQAIASLRANTLFMSTSTAFNGVAYHQEPDVVKTKRAFMQIVDKRVLLLDSKKFGITALIRLADLTEFDVVLTDNELPEREEEMLRKAGVNLTIVKNPAEHAADGAAGMP